MDRLGLRHWQQGTLCRSHNSNLSATATDHEAGTRTTDPARPNLMVSSARYSSMNKSIQLLDVVALTEDLPDHGLFRGQVGTVVESLASDVFEVEFSDDEGRTYASLDLLADQLMVLH